MPARVHMVYHNGDDTIAKGFKAQVPAELGRRTVWHEIPWDTDASHDEFAFSLHQADIVVVLASPDLLAEGYVAKAGFARDLRRAKPKVCVVPARSAEWRVGPLAQADRPFNEDWTIAKAGARAKRRAWDWIGEQTGVDVQPEPEKPAQRKGAKFSLTAGGFDVDATDRALVTSETAQRALHGQIHERLGRLNRLGNTYPKVAFQIDAYSNFLGKTIGETDVASLWSVGNTLSQYIDAFELLVDMSAGHSEGKAAETPNGENSTPPSLDVDLLADLKALKIDHTAFVLGFRLGQQLLQNAAELKNLNENSKQVEAVARRLLRDMLGTGNLLAQRARLVIKSIDGAFEDFDRHTFAVVATATDTSLAALVAFALAVYPLVVAGDIVDALQTVVLDDSQRITLRAAMGFLASNARQAFALAALEPQVLHWLRWLIDRLQTNWPVHRS